MFIPHFVLTGGPDQRGHFCYISFRALPRQTVAGCCEDLASLVHLLCRRELLSAIGGGSRGSGGFSGRPMQTVSQASAVKGSEARWLMFVLAQKLFTVRRAE